MVTLTVGLLIITLAFGSIRFAAGSALISRKGQIPDGAVIDLATMAEQIAHAVSEDGSGRSAIQLQQLFPIRDAQSDVPLNPVLADPLQIERVYTERTGSSSRARAFIFDIGRFIATGDLLTETEVRSAAGIDYMNIVGFISGEPILNLNTVARSRLLELPNLVAPGDPLLAQAITDMIRGFLDVRMRREISAAEIAAAIQTTLLIADDGRPAANNTSSQRAIQQLSAYLGVRTWVWELTLERDRWMGTAIIARLPGHAKAEVIGLSVQAQRN